MSADCDREIENEAERMEIQGTVLMVEKVYSQVVFTSDVDHDSGTGGFILIDFMEAVKGMELYCPDLTDYIRPGDFVFADRIDRVDGIPYAKGVLFDFDIDLRGTDQSEVPRYFTGIATVKKVDEWYAKIRATEPIAGPDFRELLLPITALTKDCIPVGKEFSKLRLTDLISRGEKIMYKVPFGKVCIFFTYCHKFFKHFFVLGTRQKFRCISAQKQTSEKGALCGRKFGRMTGNFLLR